jgi:hypothetical protein
MLSSTGQVLTHAIDAATATTTSDAVDVVNAKRVTFFFQRTNHSAGKTVFSVLVSVDNSDFTITSAMLIPNVIGDNSKTLAHVASYDTGTANATAIYALDLSDFCFQAIKVVATETTDGTHDAWVLVQY